MRHEEPIDVEIDSKPVLDQRRAGERKYDDRDDDGGGCAKTG
jgi:hypothetical protein